MKLTKLTAKNGRNVRFTKKFGRIDSWIGSDINLTTVTVKLKQVWLKIKKRPWNKNWFHVTSFLWLELTFLLRYILNLHSGKKKRIFVVYPGFVIINNYSSAKNSIETLFLSRRFFQRPLFKSKVKFSYLFSSKQISLPWTISQLFGTQTSRGIFLQAVSGWTFFTNFFSKEHFWTGHSSHCWSN